MSRGEVTHKYNVAKSTESADPTKIVSIINDTHISEPWLKKSSNIIFT